MTRLSAHFAEAELACRCGGRLPGCRGVLVVPELVAGLEALRALAYPRGLRIESGYRCPERNTLVGGKPASQHLWGAAADVEPRAELADVTALRVFSGIGWQRVGGRRLVRHVDVRHASGHDTTGGTVARPTTWEYT
jgi:hypothetical protein